MSDEKAYKCAECFSITGEAIKDQPGQENWYWSTAPWFAGPFCCNQCADRFRTRPEVNQVFVHFQSSDLGEALLRMRQRYLAEVHIGIFTMRWSRNTIVPESANVHGGDLGPLDNIAFNADACHRLDLVVGQGAQGEMGD